MIFKCLLSFAFISSLIFGVFASVPVDMTDPSRTRMLEILETAVTRAKNDIMAVSKKRGSKPMITPELLQKRNEFVDSVKREYNDFDRICDQIVEASISQIENFRSQLLTMGSTLGTGAIVVRSVDDARLKYPVLLNPDLLKTFFIAQIIAALTFCIEVIEAVEAGEADELVNMERDDRFSQSITFDFQSFFGSSGTTGVTCGTQTDSYDHLDISSSHSVATAPSNIYLRSADQSVTRSFIIANVGGILTSVIIALIFYFHSQETK